MHKDQEPKYAAIGDRIYNRASGEVIPDDEPIFILRARDIKAADAIDEYMMICIASDLDDDHVEAVRQRWQDFINFRHANPDRMKKPDTAKR